MGTWLDRIFNLLSGWYKALVSKEKKAQGRRKKDLGKGRPKSKESEIIELWPAFKVENFALHYIHKVAIYQRSTTAKRAAHTSAVEMAINFWRLGFSWRCCLIFQIRGATEELVQSTHGLQMQ